VVHKRLGDWTTASDCRVINRLEKDTVQRTGPERVRSFAAGICSEGFKENREKNG